MCVPTAQLQETGMGQQKWVSQLTVKTAPLENEGSIVGQDRMRFIKKFLFCNFQAINIGLAQRSVSRTAISGMTQDISVNQQLYDCKSQLCPPLLFNYFLCGEVIGRAQQSQKNIIHTQPRIFSFIAVKRTAVKKQMLLGVQIWSTSCMKGNARRLQ